MDARLEQLVAGSFRTVPAAQANEAIERVRREVGGENPEAPLGRSYEIVLTTWEEFASGALAKMIYHLESLGAHLPACGGVVVAAFKGNELLFVPAQDFIAAAARLLRTTTRELAARHGTGESRTAQRGEPLLLPPPPSGK